MKKLIFDGEQEEFYNLTDERKCLNCRKRILIQTASLASANSLNEEEKAIIADLNSNIFIKNISGSSFVKVKNFDTLGLQYFSLDCPHCGFGQIHLYAAGEIQPSRFYVYYLGASPKGKRVV